MKTVIQLSTTLLFLFTTFTYAQTNTFLKKYAGTYHMLADGQKVTKTTDLYVLSADGKAGWTFYTTINPDGTVSNKATKNSGTWSAEEGIIHLNFAVEGGDQLLSDFYLKEGVFRAEGVFLKKYVVKAK